MHWVRPLEVTKRRWLDALVLLAFAIAALLIHGYHPAAEDAAIYLPAIKKDLNPALYSFGSEFFMSHARLTCFDEVIAWSVKLSHVELGNMLLLWQLLSIYLLLWACLLLSEAIIPQRSYRWTAVGIMMAILTIPVAGTSLLIMDPYLTPRSFSTPLLIFALLAALRSRYWLALACLLVTFPIHPLMTVYGAAFCGLLLLVHHSAWRTIVAKMRSSSFLSSTGGVAFWLFVFAAAVVSLLLFAVYTFVPPVSPAYHAALLTRSYFFLKKWAWYECVGLIAPLVMMYFFAAAAKKRKASSFAALCNATIIFGLISIGFGILFSTSSRLESVAELQPLRAFHSIYVVFFVLIGAELGRSLFGSSYVRHALLLVPVSICMLLVQRATFPATRHVEWPWSEDKNPWLKAFVWIRQNTPTSAIFALRPDHMNVAGEDNEGFRAVAERSMLADHSKDAGVVTMFPGLARTWNREVSSVQHWDRFGVADFQQLSHLYGVSWIVLEHPVSGVVCPYQNESVLVCRVPRGPSRLPVDIVSVADRHPRTQAVVETPMPTKTSAPELPRKAVVQIGSF